MWQLAGGAHQPARPAERRFLSGSAQPGRTADRAVHCRSAAPLMRKFGGTTPCWPHAPATLSIPNLSCRRRLPHGREGCRDQQLVLLPHRAYPGLWRPCSTRPTGFLTDAGALGEVLVHPDMDEFVEPAEF